MKYIAKTASQYALFLTGCLFLNSAIAAPPFITEDSEPTEYKHLELYLFSTMDKGSDSTSMQLPAIEADWGFAPDWQLHIAAPIAGNLPREGANIFSSGDLETSITYRFIKETDTFPQIAISPQIQWPTGDSERGLSNGRVWMKLPLALKKSWGPWTTYGGGGYAINPALEKQNYAFAGWAIQRELNEKITLGGEVYTQGASGSDSQSYTFVNLGGSYNIDKHFSFLLSVGHSVVGEGHTLGYLGIHWVS